MEVGTTRALSVFLYIILRFGLFRIHQSILFDIIEHIFQIPLCQILRHGQIHIQVVATITALAPGTSPSKSRMNSHISIISGTISLDS